MRTLGVGIESGKVGKSWISGIEDLVMRILGRTIRWQYRCRPSEELEVKTELPIVMASHSGRVELGCNNKPWETNWMRGKAISRILQMMRESDHVWSFPPDGRTETFRE